MIRKTLGHYRIESRLGEGGMGVVYKARDTHLDRPVAIKVLIPEAASSPARRQRFVQEARAASALDHPNIVTVHDIAEAEGQHFIVMQYVAGQTLRGLLGRGGLPWNETLRYAIQTADALAQAHAHGIVHRDLKPENVMVTEQGQVKILDFGLAKLTEPTESDEAAPTETLKPHTEEGTILGTVAYMSPEQAEGKKVDARSDIFSFGSVLYEMVTGRRAFQGQTKISTWSAILHQEPAPIREVVEGAPHELQRIIGQCLRKDLRRRFQHMDDVRVELEALKEESDSGRLTTVSPPERPARRRVPAVAITAAMILAGVGVGIAWWLTRAPKAAPAPVLTRLTSDSGLTTDPAVSPDGKLLAYASDRSGEGNLEIWLQHVAGGEPRRLTQHQTDDHEPAFSPDGATIVFRSEQDGAGVYAVSTLAGEPRKIAPLGRRPRFSPDGSQIAYWVGEKGGHAGQISRGRIYVLPSFGGQPRAVVSDFAVASHPMWLPDGKRLLFLGRRDATEPPAVSFDWWVAPVDGGPAKRTGVFAALRRAKLSALPRTTVWSEEAPFIPEAWLAPSHSILFTGSTGDSANVWEVRLSPSDWQVVGTPRQLTFGTAVDVQPSVAPDPEGGARLVFASLSGSIDVWSLPLNASQGKVVGEIRRLTQDASSAISPVLSGDGKKLVFVSRRSGNPDVWIKDLQAGTEAAVTATPNLEGYPILSPDGSRVAYQVYEGETGSGGRYPIYIADSGGGVPHKVCEDCGLTDAWSPDGKMILYSSWATPPQHIGLLDLDSGKKAQLLKHSRYTVWSPRFSADGRWIAFVASLEDQRKRLFVAPFRAGQAGQASPAEGEWIDVTAGEYDSTPAWSPDGNLLYFTSEREGFRCIWARRLDPATKRPLGAPVDVYHSHSARRSLANVPLVPLGIAVAGDKIAFTLGELTGNIWAAKLGISWATSTPGSR